MHGMTSDDDYDVHAVEAKLARMQHACQLRAQTHRQAVASSATSSGHHRGGSAADGGHVALAAFDLSTRSDGSDAEQSDSEGNSSSSTVDGAGQRHRRHPRGKPSLRDSLDLSMSMSITMPNTAKPTKQPRSRRENHTCSQMPQVASPQAVARPAKLAEPASVPTMQTPATSHSNSGSEVATGRLVQRRREMERRAAVESVSRRQSVADTIPQPTAIPSTAIEGSSQPASSTTTPTAAGTSQRRSNNIPAPKVATKRVSARASETDATTEVSRRNEARKAVGAAPPQQQQQQQQQQKQQRVAQPQAITLATSYAWSMPSNQVPPLPQEASDSTKRSAEPEEDDLLDELLTAEERKLQQSLDALNTQLHSMTEQHSTNSNSTSTTTTTSSASSFARPSRARPATHSTPRDLSDDDIEDDRNNDTALRSTAYGGGSHVRLHQQSSPTVRSSRVKRAELSSGVHKARVRSGGPTDAVTTTEGKHKVLIKKDLAHLLF